MENSEWDQQYGHQPTYYQPAPQPMAPWQMQIANKKAAKAARKAGIYAERDARIAQINAEAAAKAALRAAQPPNWLDHMAATADARAARPVNKPSGLATLFHLCMTVMTCGLWLPVWGMHSGAKRAMR